MREVFTLVLGSVEVVDSAGTWLDSDPRADVLATTDDDGTVSSSGNMTILNLSSLHFIKMEQIAWMRRDLHCSAVNCNHKNIQKRITWLTSEFNDLIAMC